MIINQQNMDLLFTGFKGAFNKGYGRVPSAYRDIAMVVPSTTREEGYAWLGQMPKLREWLGDRVINQVRAHGYKVKNKTFEATISVPKEDIEDDQYGIFGPMLEDMGQSAAETPDELVFTTLADGFTSACYDGQNFFDTDHPVIGDDGITVGTVSNFGGGAGTPWYLLDCSRAMRPLLYQDRIPFNNLTKLDNDRDPNVFFKREYVYGVDGRGNAGYGLWQLAYGSKSTLNAANFTTAMAAMKSLRGDGGRKLNIRPTVLVCPPALEEAALKILNVDTLDGGQSNPWKGTVKLLCSAYADPN